MCWKSDRDLICTFHVICRLGVRIQAWIRQVSMTPTFSGSRIHRGHCVSVSVLEHVPAGDIRRVCEDMFRVLKPGGWTLHSIDLPADNLAVLSAPWLKCLLDAGFTIDVARTDASLGGLQELANGDSHFLEPLSIRSRFYHGYKKTIWGNPLTASMSNIHVATILVSARKPN